MLKRNLAQKVDNYEQYDKDIAFGIFLIEKEFNVGMVDDTFPLTKFWNLFNKDNIKMYNERQKNSMNNTKTMR